MTKKLTDSSPKTYWTMLNRLLYNNKLPPIPPLLVYGKLVSDFCKKANIFNNFFASIYRPKIPEKWKKANVVPVHKKEDKMLVKNYRPISYFLFFENFFKELYIIRYSTIFEVIDFSHFPNLVFLQEIHVLPNYYQ